MPQVTARGAAAERPAGPPPNGRRPRGPFGGGAPPPRAAAARRRAAAQRPPGFFELGAFYGLRMEGCGTTCQKSPHPERV